MTCSCALAAAVNRCQTAPADVRLTQWQPERGLVARLTTGIEVRLPRAPRVLLIAAPASLSPDTRPAPPSAEDGR